MEIKTVTIFIDTPEQTRFFKVGDKILIGGKETDVIVKSISIGFFSKLIIKFSNGDIYMFSGVKYLITN